MSDPWATVEGMEKPATLAHLPYADLLQPHHGGLMTDERYDTVHFDGLAIQAPQAPGAGFLECAVTDCVMTGGTLRGAGFNDVWVHGTRFTGTALPDTDWQDSTVEACVLAAVEAFGSRLRRVVFRRCKFDSVNLRTAALREVTFEDCVLRDVDFAGAKLVDVSFPGSSLERAHFAHTSLARVDLRGATTLDLADGYDALRGATITTGQLLDLAPALAHALGVKVQDLS